MQTQRLSARPPGGPHMPQRRAQDVFRRFFDLIERMERNHPAAPAPETKARISRLDVPPRRPA